MKKTLKHEGLDCGHCAALNESKVAKLKGVSSVSVNFLTTKMVIEGDDASMDEILENAKAIVKKIEPDVVVKKA